MAKLDGLKEYLNTLRVIFTVIVLIVIAITGHLVNRVDSDKIDYFLYFGTVIDFSLMISIPIILKKIAKVTKEIKYTKE